MKKTFLFLSRPSTTKTSPSNISPNNTKTMLCLPLLLFVLLVCVGNARQLRVREEQIRELQIGGLCAQFWSPSYFNATAGFMEYTIPLPFVVSNYFLWVNTTIASQDTGILVGWNLYGSLGTSNNTAPTTATDPSWVLLDTETGVDFSVPQNSFLPSLYAFNVSSNGVAYPYFGFVFTTPLPPSQFVCPVVRLFANTLAFSSANVSKPPCKYHSLFSQLTFPLLRCYPFPFSSFHQKQIDFCEVF